MMNEQDPMPFEGGANVPNPNIFPLLTTTVFRNKDEWRNHVFNDDCDIIQANDARLLELDLSLSWTGENGLLLVNDDHAMRLGSALDGNQSLHSMRLGIRRGMTAVGAQALADGIRGSKIKTLFLQAADGETRANLFPLIFFQALQSVTCLHLAGSEYDFFREEENLVRVAEMLVTSDQLRSIKISLPTKTSAACMEALAIGIRDSQLESMWVVNRSVASDGPRQAAKQLFLETAVGKLKQLTLTELRDQDATFMGNALVGNKSLETLAFSLHELTPIGARHLARGIAKSWIKVIKFTDNGWFDAERREASTVDDILLLEGVAGSHVETLCLDACSSNRFSLAPIPPGIKSLELIKLRFPIVAALLPSLCNAHLLNELTLSGCFGIYTCHHDLRCLMKALRGLQINKLDLSSNSIGDRGAVILAKAWAKRELPFKELSLQYNGIGEEGAQAIVTAAGNENMQTRLQKLDLTGNSSIGLRGLAMIARSLPSLVLKNLFLSCRRVVSPYVGRGRRRVQAAQSETPEQVGAAWVSALKNYDFLVTLTIHGMNLPSNTVKEIFFWVNINRVRSLLREAQLPRGLWCRAISKCLDDPWSAASLVFFLLQNNPTII